MKKVFLIAGLGAVLFTGCLVNIPDDVAALVIPETVEQPQETPTEEPETKKTTEEPAAEEPAAEPAAEPVKAEPETKSTVEEPKRDEPVIVAEPEEEPVDVEEPKTEEPEPAEPEEVLILSTPQEPEETPAEVEEPAEEEVKVIDWRAFYARVEQKGREKYDGKLPWSYLAKDAHIGMSSWMSDPGSCSRYPPSEEVIRKIAQVLDVTYEWLIYG